MSDLARMGGSLPSPNLKIARDAPITPENRLPVVDRAQVDPTLLKAAEGMEAMFLDYLMKVMRDTVPKSDENSPALGIYQSMRDHQFAQSAARRGGIGLAEQIVAYMEAQRYNLNRDQGSVQKQGANHEGQSHDQ